MNQLERRYRLLLKVLPSWYRAEREEEMVGIFLDSRVGDGYDELDGEYGWPGWPEARSTLGLAVRTRFAAGNAPARAVTLGDVTRRIALLGLVVGAMWTGAFVASTVWAALHSADVVRVRPWNAVELAPLLALVALVTGRRTLAKVLAAVLVVAGLVSLVLEPLQGGSWLQWAVHVSFLVPWWLTFTCLCLGFHREAATPSPRPWLVAAAVAVPVGAVAAWFMVPHLLVPAAAFVVLAVLRWRDPVMAAAVAVSSAALLPEANLVLAAGPAEFAWAYVPAIVLLTAGTFLPLLAEVARRASVPGFRRP